MCRLENLGMLLFLLVGSFWDWKTKKVPVMLLGGMAAFMCLCWAIVPEQNMISIIIGLLIGCVFLLISRCTREAIGYGDSWILLILGGHLGGINMSLVAMTSFIFAAVVSSVKLVRGNWNRKLALPFVPFLTMAYIGVMLYEKIS